MSLFLKLVTALEIILLLKKLREQNETSTSNSNSYTVIKNPVQKKRQGTDANNVEIRQS